MEPGIRAEALTLLETAAGTMQAASTRSAPMGLTAWGDEGRQAYGFNGQRRLCFGFPRL